MSNTSLSHPQDDAAYWAGRINRDLRSVGQGIIKTGQTLLRAKAKLAHGQWGALFANKLIPISERTAQRFMAIASHPILSNPTHVSHLPPTWGTLYELTRVDPETLTFAVEDGRIHPGMERRDVKALLPPKPTAKPSDPFYVIQTLLTESYWAAPAAEQARLIANVRHLLSTLEEGGPEEDAAIPSWLSPHVAAVAAAPTTDDDDEKGGA
jgi:hypothetical protein